MGGYDLRRVPRGRYLFETVELSIDDPFGLALACPAEREAEALVVFRRRAERRSLFSETGTRASDGVVSSCAVLPVSAAERATTRRASRCAASTGRRRHAAAVDGEGVEDAPRDEIAVLLDGDSSAVVAKPPDSTFDAAVRAADRSSRRTRAADAAPCSSSRSAARQPNPADRLRRSGLAPRARAARRGGADGARVGLLAAGRGGGSVGSLARPRRRHFPPRSASSTGSAGAPWPVAERRSSTSSRRASRAAARPDAGLLRLYAAGAPVAVVRRGADLAAAPSAAPAAEAAHA